LWPAFTYLKLHQPVRNASGPEYAEWVDNIGLGTTGYDGADVELDMIADVNNIVDAIQFYIRLKPYNSRPKAYTIRS
jgi:hypothetical protein